MTTPLVKGWCPGALRPMPSGDGLLVRVRPSIGRLTQAQAAGIARLAEQYGNGQIDLSARANIQIRGVTDPTYAQLVMGLATLGLIDATPEAEARRNIVVTPFWQSDDGTTKLTERLGSALRDDRTLALPGKFGFAVDTGATPVLRDVSADIRIERDATGNLLCRANGAASGARVTSDTAVDTALSLARWFISSGGRKRMAVHLADGATLPSAFTAVKAAPMTHMSLPMPGQSASGFMIGLAFGQMQARTLSALADIAPLRVTPWRMLLLEGLISAPNLAGVITRADDPLLRVIACPGLPGCTQALQPTRPLARVLAPYAPVGRMLHVSGCAKGCAHPGPTPLTLVAQAHDFGLVRDGNATSTPQHPPLTVEQLLANPGTLMENPNALPV
ncbi:precorrin-3B synthase [Acetobacter aceti]|uniref:Precorrin-3B synthase n=1 Tax=Acetobacter aceti TaxID=435 RepID=A0A6S6PB06_ACEAC|nr:precorrin-3B synthase [Acetobacter aceti]BCI65947.1 precorrin-3B synthase [Acetobacter aceti]